MLRTGPGSDAIGSESWVWGAMRPLLRALKPQIDMVAALSPLRTFDESRTIGELARKSVKSPDEMRAQLRVIYDKALQEATNSTGGDAHRAKAIADQFVTRVVAHLPTPGTKVRDLLVSTLVSQGLDAEEIRDECVLADLSELGLFRSQLRVVASETGRSFDDLKGVAMAVTAAREIAYRTCAKYGIPLFILHDFDVSGFSIARTLHTSNRRYTHATECEVVDLGLRLEDVAGLESEPVYLGDGDKENRREKLQENRATDEEIDFLLDVDNPSEHWGTRVELNAFGSRQLIEFI